MADEHDERDATGAPAPRWVGFGAAIAICFRKYVDFTGRAGRPEFWFWTLFQILVSLIPLAMAALVSRPGNADGVIALFVITWAVLFLPTLAVTARRLHDTDRSGWWILINLVLVGGFVLLVFMCERGTKGPNRFGPQVAT